MALYAAELLQLELPRSDKRMFAFVESEGCWTDGVAVAAGCSLGSRTVRLVDYGKVAAIFLDTVTHRAVRVLPTPQSRAMAQKYCPHAVDRWHAQLAGYQLMPDQELLLAQEVSLKAPFGRASNQRRQRVTCVGCGEEIMCESTSDKTDPVLCQACSGDAYYVL